MTWSVWLSYTWTSPPVQMKSPTSRPVCWGDHVGQQGVGGNVERNARHGSSICCPAGSSAEPSPLSPCRVPGACDYQLALSGLPASVYPMPSPVGQNLDGSSHGNAAGSKSTCWNDAGYVSSASCSSRRCLPHRPMGLPLKHSANEWGSWRTCLSVRESQGRVTRWRGPIDTGERREHIV